ncbi:D-alanyl-D-alanine carboxypeptidase family protein [Paracandidimonas soli]|uniref:D-alanyl-D-alanine carboxypeptidase family protein n=1 Tax=Paracandidimonas soli TaxID=1917182 RepID=UPI00334290F3
MPQFLNRISFSRLAAGACIAGALALPSLSAHAQAAPEAPPAAAARGNAPQALVGSLSAVPAPSLPVKAWLSLDANSGQIIAAENIDERIEPASLTKLMAAYLVFEALESKRLTLEQTVNVSEQAWRMEGSRMFIKPNTQVSVHDLLQGLIVQSGNDATVALAEAVAGSESAFVALMNQEAQRQGLTSTNFVNSPGMPDPDHLTTVRDLGILAKNLVMRFPQYTHYYSQKEYTYNNIKQNNRNRLLWLDPTVDGLKTGHTQSAGYCLVATAVRDGRRVITVVVGASNDAARAESSLRLMNWSFQNFDTLSLFDAEHPVVQARVWQGQAETVGLGATEPMWVTVPRGQAQQLKPEAMYAQPLVAPLQKGAQVGSVALTLNGQVLRSEPLYVLNDVAEAGFFGRLYDKIRLMFE